MASLNRFVSLSATFLRPRLLLATTCQYSSVKTAGDDIDAGKIAHEDPHYGKIFTKEHKMPDSLGESVGSTRFELLSKLLGNDDPFEMKPVRRRPNSREQPNLVPCTTHVRLMGCVCNTEINYIHWMRLQQNVTMRCKCGHYFRLVDYNTFNKSENEYLQNRYEKVKDLPDMKTFLQESSKDSKLLDELFTKYESLDEKSDEAQKVMHEMYEIDTRVKKRESDIMEKYFQ